MTPLDYLQSLCLEAAELFGNDWQAINRHISEQLDKLVEPERARLSVEVDRILRFQVPENGSARRLQ